MLLLQALWVLAISQDRNQDRSPQESLGKRQRFVKFVHKGMNTEKGNFKWLLERSWGRVLKGARWGKSYI